LLFLPSLKPPVPRGVPTATFFPPSPFPIDYDQSDVRKPFYLSIFETKDLNLLLSILRTSRKNCMLSLTDLFKNDFYRWSSYLLLLRPQFFCSLHECFFFMSIALLLEKISFVLLFQWWTFQLDLIEDGF
jgi:hypothetical protein